MNKADDKLSGKQIAFFVLLPVLCILISLTLGIYRISVPHVFRILWGRISGHYPEELKDCVDSVTTLMTENIKGA